MHQGFVSNWGLTPTNSQDFLVCNLHAVLISVDLLVVFINFLSIFLVQISRISFESELQYRNEQFSSETIRVSRLKLLCFPFVTFSKIWTGGLKLKNREV